MDRLARAGWLSHRPERLDGQLRRAAPCRPEGWYLYHGGDGQFPGQSADEQIEAHALVAARGQSPPPSSLRRLQWYAWFWLGTEILPSQRYATASGDCRLNPPNLRRSRSCGRTALFSRAESKDRWRLLHNSAKTGPRDDTKLAAIKLEWWPRSDWNRWPPSLESALGW